MEENVEENAKPIPVFMERKEVVNIPKHKISLTPFGFVNFRFVHQNHRKEKEKLCNFFPFIN